MMHNYTIIRCQTYDKCRVMDLLCDADEYEFARNHVDVIYYNGDTSAEKKMTRTLVKDNIAKLIENDIPAKTKSEYLDDWLFITLP